MVEIFCDGSCNLFTGKDGGWAFVVVQNDINVYETWGNKTPTTNSEMEIMALKEALKFAMRTELPVTIYSDSTYCVQSYNEWTHNWAKKDWKKSNNKEVKHPDHWKEIHELRSPLITVKWVKGHAGHKWNERADLLCSNRES